MSVTDSWYIRFNIKLDVIIRVFYFMLSLRFLLVDICVVLSMSATPSSYSHNMKINALMCRFKLQQKPGVNVVAFSPACSRTVVIDERNSGIQLYFNVRIEESAVNPESALVDDPWHVLVTGLSPWQLVTLAAVLVEDGHVFVSHAFYVSNGNGCLDLAESASHDGTYQGIEPMGLLWSMKPAPGQMKGLRLIKRDVSQPFIISVSVISGHHTVLSQADITSATLLASLNVKRYYMAPDVTCYTVRVGDIRGKFFLPPGDGPFPGIIDMFGSAGGLIEFRSALLASRGFAVLALAYFNYEDLPHTMILNMEYFEEAVDWLHSHPCVMKSGIGVIGVSKGASLGLHMAVMSHKVKAVVAINGTAIHTSGLHYYRGAAQPVYNGNFEATFSMTDEGAVYGKAFSLSFAPSADYFIPVDKAEHCSFLLINSEDDPSNGTEHVESIVERLDQHSRHNYQVLRYQGTGHLIEPPYMPLCRVAYSKIFMCPVVYGGEMRSHAMAQDDAWQQTLTFLWKKLNPGRINKRCRFYPGFQSCELPGKPKSKL